MQVPRSGTFANPGSFRKRPNPIIIIIVLLGSCSVPEPFLKENPADLHHYGQAVLLEGQKVTSNTFATSREKRVQRLKYRGIICVSADGHEKRAYDHVS